MQEQRGARRVGVLAQHVSGGAARLAGKRCVVTGAGSGIGRASAVLFAQQGASVVVSDVNDEGVAETVRLIEAGGGRAVGRVCDVGDEAQVEALVELCCAELGGIDVMFANAGIAFGGPFWKEDAAGFAQMMRVNVIGVFNCFKFASLKMMAADKGGALIATASVAGILSGAGDASYAASKAAVINLCRVVANQLTSTRIRCNCICPGLIETGMTAGLFAIADERGARKKVGQINPLQRYGRADEIANVALFLASDESSYVNGQHIAVDGGLTSSMPVARRGKGIST